MRSLLLALLLFACPALAADDAILGIWGGRWDQAWAAFFMVLKQESGAYRIVYKWQEDVGGPFQVDSFEAQGDENEIIGRNITILLSPSDPARALAVGNFKKPRTAFLYKLPDTGVENLTADYLDRHRNQAGTPTSVAKRNRADRRAGARASDLPGDQTPAPTADQAPDQEDTGPGK
jgi:hypothetical protein